MIRKDRLTLGVSSCLLGNPVRYDGGQKEAAFITGTLAREFDLVPVCPEAECGLPVPREAMQLVGDAGSLKLMTIGTGIDHTDRLLQWIDLRLDRLAQDGLSGFMFKARSPSCAVRDALRCSPEGDAEGMAAGLFAGAVMRRFPQLPVIDEEELAVPSARDRFLKRVRAYSGQ